MILHIDITALYDIPNEYTERSSFVKPKKNSVYKEDWIQIFRDVK